MPVTKLGVVRRAACTAQYCTLAVASTYHLRLATCARTTYHLQLTTCARALHLAPCEALLQQRVILTTGHNLMMMQDLQNSPQM